MPQGHVLHSYAHASSATLWLVLGFLFFFFQINILKGVSEMVEQGSRVDH